jgi:hypothetical protein
MKLLIKHQFIQILAEIQSIFDKIRQKILLAHTDFYLGQEEKSFGEFELDESYFGAKRVRGKKRQRSSWKNTCFWTIKTRWKSLCRDSKKLH